MLFNTSTVVSQTVGSGMRMHEQTEVLAVDTTKPSIAPRVGDDAICGSHFFLEVGVTSSALRDL